MRTGLRAAEAAGDFLFSGELACLLTVWRYPLAALFLAVSLLGPRFSEAEAVVILLYAAGRALRQLRYRRHSLRLGLRSIFVYPGSPALLRPLLRRWGLTLPQGIRVLEPHVLIANRRYRRLPLAPAERAAVFRGEMEEDYRLLVRLLAGKPVTLVSNTFNHRPDWFAELCQQAGGLRTGVLCPENPRSYRPALHRRRQRRLFGGVVSRRDVSRFTEWTIALLNLREVEGTATHFGGGSTCSERRRGR